MKIVVLDGYTLNPGDLSWTALERLGEVTIYDRTPEERIVERIGDAEVVLTNKTPITAATIKKTNMHYIGLLATGYNVVDITAARERGIPVTNIPCYGTQAVAQFTVALLLELCHHVGAHSDSVFRGDWQNNVDWCYWNSPLMELSGKTLGVIGFGKIGQTVGKIADALGMTVLYYDQHPVANCSFAEAVSLKQLLKNSDVISLHCPLLDSTHGIINEATISQMKSGVLLLNTSRGSLIVEQDLADALQSGKVAGAAMDVASTEPICAVNPLLCAPHCILTPHIAWAAKESRIRLMNLAVDNVVSFQNGRPVHVVNL